MRTLLSTRSIGAALNTALLMATAAIPTAARGDTTWVRAFHDSPDTGKVDILLDGSPTSLTGVPYGGISPYLALPVGARVTVRIVEGSAAGATLDITVPDSRHPITVAAIGSLTALIDEDRGNDASALRLKAFSDRAGGLWNISLVRVVHTSPDAPKVDVQVRLGNRWVTIVDGLAFGRASAYLPLPQRILGRDITYTFRVVLDRNGAEVTRLSTTLPYKALSVWAQGFAAKGVGTTPDSFGLFITKDGRN